MIAEQKSFRTVGGTHDHSSAAAYVAEVILRRWMKKGFRYWRPGIRGPEPSTTATNPGLNSAAGPVARALLRGVRYFPNPFGIPYPL